VLPKDRPRFPSAGLGIEDVSRSVDKDAWDEAVWPERKRAQVEEVEDADDSLWSTGHVC